MVIPFLNRIWQRRPQLRLAFNPLGRPKAGLWADVLVVDAPHLKTIISLHPFNQNLTKTVGRDKNFPPYLSIGRSQATYFIICDEEKRIIAGATLRPHKIRTSEMVISQISVHRDFRNQGYATRLLTVMRDTLNTSYPEVKRLTISRFMPMGKKFLRHKFIALSKEFKADTFESSQ